MNESVEQPVTLGRQELYARMWQSPASQIAKEFGLSDVGLAKLCDRHDIPRPPRGYWAKLKFGKPTKPVPLPSPDDNHEITIRPQEAAEKAAKTVEEQILQPSYKEPAITVAKSLEEAHSLVQLAREQAHDAATDKHGFLKLRKKCPLDLHVTQASLERSLLIADAVLKSLEERGYPAQRGPVFSICDVKLSFRIEEQMEKIREEPEEHDLEGEYQFGHSRFLQRSVPSGLLSVIVVGPTLYSGLGCRQNWNDNNKRRLEQHLNSIVRGLVRVAVRQNEEAAERKRREEEWRDAERRRQEAQRQREEKRKLYKAEKARVAKLRKNAKAWRESQDLRDYIAATRELLESTRPEDAPIGDINEWVDWANRHADRLDPLTESPPSILDEEDLDEDDARPHQYAGSWRYR